MDDDLRFEDGPGNPRSAVVVNLWLRELPVNGAPARRTWRVYAEALRAWLEFLSERGVAPFGSRQELRSVLSAYAGYRLSESPQHRWDGATWNLHVVALSRFYVWAQDEGCAGAGPFSYSTGKRITDGAVWTHRRNHAKLRPAKRHSQIKYLEHDFTAVLLNALAGLDPDGTPDGSYRGRELGRNAAMGRLALASGLRRHELTHLLVYEVPPLPARRSAVPVAFPLGRGTTKAASPAQPGSTTTPWSRSGTTFAWNAPPLHGDVRGSPRSGGVSRCGCRIPIGRAPASTAPAARGAR